MNSNRNPLLSVVVPVYNGENYIEGTLNQILKSKYKNLEVVVVIDGCHDKSQEICERMAESDNRIKVYFQDNKGIAGARNTGIEMSNGEYIGFCDQDDIVDENMYSKMIKRIVDDNSDLCLCSTLKYDDRGKSAPYDKLEDAVYKKNEIEYHLLAPLLTAEFNCSLAGSGLMVSPAVWKCIVSKVLIQEHNIQFRRFVSYEDDYLFSIEVFCAAKKISTVKEFFYKWRINFNSESHQEKYVEDIEYKQNQLKQYICNVLEKGKVSEELISFYKNATECINIVKIYENVAARNCPFSWKYKKEYIRKIIENKKCFVNMTGVFLKKGFFRYKYILFYVEKNKFIIAYFVNIVLKYVSKCLFKMHVGALIEMFVKGHRKERN